MPRPLSTTSMMKSSSTLTFTVERGRLRVSNGIADRFSDDRFGVIGKPASTTDNGPDELDGGAQRSGRRTARWPRPASPQSGDFRLALVQVEDRGTDLLDDFLKIIHAVGKPLLHFGRCVGQTIACLLHPTVRTTPSSCSRPRPGTQVGRVHGTGARSSSRSGSAQNDPAGRQPTAAGTFPTVLPTRPHR